MSKELYQQFVESALLMQGAPYIWGGKGRLQFKDGALLKHLFVDQDNNPINVYDCSGVVTCALYNLTSGRIDLRGTHSAEKILETFPECAADFGDGTLILYPGHVAIDLGRNRVIDANRGDHSCISLQHAAERKARVEIHRSGRPGSAILGYRRIPLDKSELKQ